MSSALAFALLAACGSAPSETEDDYVPDDDTENPGSDDDDGDPDTEGCTAATDAVPMSEIVDAIQNVPGTYVYDIERAKDGTVYFISGMSAASATIGRREPCGTIEREWLSASVPIEQIEISSDNQLYFVANGLTSKTARLYRVNLADPMALPKQLLSQAGYEIESISAGVGGRVFLSRWGTNGVTLGYVGTDGAVKLPWNLGAGSALVAGRPDGKAFVYRDTGLLTARYGGTLTVSSTGTVSVTMTAIPIGGPLDYPIRSIRADANGGVYMQSVELSATDDFCRLHHATDLLSPRTQTAEVPYAYACGTQFGVEAPTSAAMISMDPASNTTPVMTAVTLPVPVMQP